jgi:CelD/BcsL family acetyltransferase involved in cellulose biosynthesis
VPVHDLFPGPALSIERIEPLEDDWRQMATVSDRLVFQIRAWLDFVARTQNADPVVAAVLRDGERVGYFTGLVVRRFGMRILGSPFPGWTTASMGFTLPAGVSRRDAAAALPEFAFGPLRCVYLELVDRGIAPGELDGLGFDSDVHMTLEVDLADDEAAIFGRMSSACRRAVRKAEKSGVSIEIASGTGFADEYYEQLRGVFARQSLVPTYDIERVRELIRCLGPGGNLLMLRCLSPDGRCIATSLFPAHDRTAYFWGGASLREDQTFRPNEAMFWYAMRYWRERGVQVLDLAGPNDYKRRYGGAEVWVPSFTRSRFRGLSSMRDLAQTAVQMRQRWQGRRLPATATQEEPSPSEAR